jgi:hypothetical protein
MVIQIIKQWYDRFINSFYSCDTTIFTVERTENGQTRKIRWTFNGMNPPKEVIEEFDKVYKEFHTFMDNFHDIINKEFK